MDKKQILVVDDVDINRIILEEILQEKYEIAQAASGMEAINILLNTEYNPSMILLDIMMPEMDGFEVLQIIKSNPQISDVPVIFITAADASDNETRGLSEGAIDYIVKPFNADVVKQRVGNQIELHEYRKKLEHLVEEKVQELMATKDNLVETMATIIEYRNLESGQHVKRTSDLTRIIINHLMTIPKFREQLIKLDPELIVKATPLHDVGKIGIPDLILLKPGRLDDDEYDVIKTHTTIGSDIIDSIMASNDELYLRHCREIARYHHERWDGKGYPDKLSGEDIPLSARILSIVDVYDALVSHRVYKPAFSHKEAMRIIFDGKGTQFDPDLIDAISEIHEEFQEVEGES